MHFCSRVGEVVVVATNGKERDHEQTADTSQLSQDESSKSGCAHYVHIYSTTY